MTLVFWACESCSFQVRRWSFFLFCWTFFSCFSHFLSSFPLSRAGELLDLSLLCYSPGSAAQPNSFNYHTQPALSYHRGCAAPSVFPSWLCREDRHLPKVSWSASLLSLLSLFSVASVDLPFFVSTSFSWLPPLPSFSLDVRVCVME